MYIQSSFQLHSAFTDPIPGSLSLPRIEGWKPHSIGPLCIVINAIIPGEIVALPVYDTPFIFNITIIIIFGSAHGHLLMKTPTPFGKSTINSSPLEADNFDFPCKHPPSVYGATGILDMMVVGVN